MNSLGIELSRKGFRGVSGTRRIELMTRNSFCAYVSEFLDSSGETVNTPASFSGMRVIWFKGDLNSTARALLYAKNKRPWRSEARPRMHRDSSVGISCY